MFEHKQINYRRTLILRCGGFIYGQITIHDFDNLDLICTNIELFLQKTILTIEILQIMCYNQSVECDTKIYLRSITIFHR